MPRWSSLALVTVLGFSLSSCASNAETGFPAESEIPTDAPSATCDDAIDEPQPYEDEIFVLDNCYVPKVATVAADEEVHWLQEGTLPHTVTFVDVEVDSHPDCDGSPELCMNEGEEFTGTLSDPGEYIYYCILHGGPDGTGMAGTLVVE